MPNRSHLRHRSVSDLSTSELKIQNPSLPAASVSSKDSDKGERKGNFQYFSMVMDLKNKDNGNVPGLEVVKKPNMSGALTKSLALRDKPLG